MRRHPDPTATSPSPRATASSPGEESRRDTALLVLASAVILAPQVAGLGHGFYLDDFTWFTGLFQAWGSPLAILAPWKPYEIRVLGQVLFALEYRLFGLQPIGYNVTSMALHLGSTILVARLAYLGGLSRNRSWVAGLIFCGGLGSLTKPITWTCAQVLQMGTFFLLCSVYSLQRWLHRGRYRSGHGSRNLPGMPRATDVGLGRTGITGPEGVAGRDATPGSSGSPDLEFRGKTGFPVLSLIFFGLALASHEIVILTFAGLAFLSWRSGYRRWWLVGLIGLALAAIYAAVTLPVHLRHPVTEGTASDFWWNLFHFPAAYLLPPQLTGALEYLLPSTRFPKVLGLLVNLLGYLVGAGVFVGALAVARQSAPSLRRLMVFSLLLFLPVLGMPMPARWVEARYLYPVTSFLAPALSGALFAAAARLSPRVRPAFLGVLVLWAAATYGGSLYMQKRAYDHALHPSAVRRWELVKEAEPRSWSAGQGASGSR